MDLYKILGIEKDATKAEIKRAYRKKAQEHHPDKNVNGSDEKFIEINEAYKVLFDDVARKRYDETGSFKKEKSCEEMALDNLKVLFMLAIEGRAPWFQNNKNLIDAIDCLINDYIDDNNSTKNGLIDEKIKVESYKKRISKKGNGQNIFIDLADAKISSIEFKIKEIKKEVEVATLVKEMLKDYEDCPFNVF